MMVLVIHRFLSFHRYTFWGDMVCFDFCISLVNTVTVWDPKWETTKVFPVLCPISDMYSVSLPHRSPGVSPLGFTSHLLLLAVPWFVFLLRHMMVPRPPATWLLVASHFLSHDDQNSWHRKVFEVLKLISFPPLSSSVSLPALPRIPGILTVYF